MSEETTKITDNVRVRVYKVDNNFIGLRLDVFLSNRIQRLSRTKATKICRGDYIEIHPKRPIKPSMKLRLGDEITLYEYLEEETLQYDEVVHIYEDEHLLALSKPSGMLVHESSKARLNTINMYLTQKNYEHTEPVHRLDRETSGVLMCAKNKAMISKLRLTFATAHPQKTYRALALDPQHRWSVGSRETLDTPLGLIPGNELELRMGRGPLHAITHVHVLGRRPHDFGEMADLEIQIETGRQHQIRVHLAFEGTPIAGDKLYTWGDQFFMDITDRPDDPELLAKLPFPRHALHAWKLALKHPVTEEEVAFTAPLPAIFTGG